MSKFHKLRGFALLAIAAITAVLPFMRAQWDGLRHKGMPADRIHREVFGPELLDHLL